MNEEAAEFKKKKQLPAPDHKKGKKDKPSGKKPWTIECEWKAGSVFKRTISSRVDGVWSERTETKTLEEIQEDRSNNVFDWTWRLWGGGWFGNYKTEKAALQAWENFKNKPNLNGQRHQKMDDRKIYKLINKKTGEEIVLWEQQ